MKQRMDISVPEEVLVLNEAKQERLRTTSRFEPADRTPVEINISQWTALAARGRTFADYIRSPRDNLIEQILNRKWRIETIRDDAPIPTRQMAFSPDFGCLRGVEFEMEIEWRRGDAPKCRHPLQRPEDIDRLAVPPPDGGLNAKRIAWYHAMRAASEELDVRLNGDPLKITVTLGQPGGPIPSAFALAGSNLFLWMALDPDRIHRLMRIVTDSHMGATRFFDDMLGRDPVHPLAMGGDAAEMIGPEMFREFVVPYYLQVWERYPGPRGFHMCGRIDHLLDILRDELEITTLNGFGFPVDRHVLAEKMAGRVELKGGPNPTLIRSGPRETIIADCISYIETVGHAGGFVLQLGGGPAAGTPVEHYHAMVEAAERAAQAPVPC
ncbi:MAG: hypothetical protein JXR37_35180 [Kiritimatiellae bacterium]|nr:hypothetical protein [Kiritimatiellia bacterium]